MGRLKHLWEYCEPYMHTQNTDNPVLSSGPVGNQVRDVPILFPVRRGESRGKHRAWCRPRENLEVVVAVRRP